jgi:hydroxypyruvate isomerase
MAQKFGAKRLIAQAGNSSIKFTWEEQWESLALGLKACSKVLEKTDITLDVEPLNPIDHKGYFLTKVEDAYRLIKDVSSKQIRILFDIYHVQVTQGNLINRFREGGTLIDHVHTAGNPGRVNITQGEISYPDVLKAIHEFGYDGWVGLEGHCEDPDNDIVQADLLIKKISK